VLTSRVTTESELARAGRSWCRGRRLSCRRRRRTRQASSILPTDERVCAFVGWPTTPGRFQKAPVFAAGHAPRSFLSFPHGVPLPAVSNLRGLAGRCRVSDSAFTFGNAPGVHCTLRRFAPTNWRHMRFRITGPTCRLSHIQLYPIVFIGPNSVTFLCWLVSVIRSRRWVRLLGLAPVCGPLLASPGLYLRPLRAFLPWVFVLFQVCGCPNGYRCSHIVVVSTPRRIISP